MIILIIKINNFRDDLIDVSAKTATLTPTALAGTGGDFVFEMKLNIFWILVSYKCYFF